MNYLPCVKLNSQYSVKVKFVINIDCMNKRKCQALRTSPNVNI